MPRTDPLVIHVMDWSAFLHLMNFINLSIRSENKPFTIVGIVKDLLVQSPYKPVRPSLFYVSKESQNVFILRMNPSWSASKSLAKIEEIFKKYNPASPFTSSFVDEEFAKK